MVFTKPSKYIQDFVDQIQIHSSVFHLSKVSKLFLKSLYDIAINAPPPKYEIVSQTRCLPNAPFPRGQVFESVDSVDIKQHIVNLDKTVSQVKLIVGSRTYNLYFVLPTGSKIVLAKCLFMMNMWFHIVDKFAGNVCSKSVDIYLYLTDLKKLLPKEQRQTIELEHVNTAFTTGCNDKTEIFIFRKEEWFKVFVHECFHNMGMDFEISTSKSQKLLQSLFQLESKCHLEESYCEMWAETINILLINVASKKTFEECLPMIERQIQYERIFSLFQTAKVLNHFGLSYGDLIEKTPEKSVLRRNYKETTEAFCYFVLKSILMFNFNEFIEWMFLNCKSIKFKENQLNKFVNELIVQKYNEMKFIKTLNVIQTFFDSSRRKSFLTNTMRMSVMELEF
jgi:hypothetical protein